MSTQTDGVLCSRIGLQDPQLVSLLAMNLSAVALASACRQTCVRIRLCASEVWSKCKRLVLRRVYRRVIAAAEYSSLSDVSMVGYGREEGGDTFCAFLPDSEFA